MDNLRSTKQLLELYYNGFAQKKGWESVISEDFTFIGGDMTDGKSTTGKKSYIEVINRFYRVFETMRVHKMIVDGENACVIGNYDFIFPSGKRVNGNVAEIWEAKDGKLCSLTILFDTLTFYNNTPK